MFNESKKQAARSMAIVSIAVLACCAGFSTSAKASCGGFTQAWHMTVLPTTSQFQTREPMAPPSSAYGEKDGNASIVGLWSVTFNANGQVFDMGIDQWHSDGTEILNDIAAPQPANGAGTICLGVFKKTGPRSVKLRHPFFSFDSNGNLAATGLILEELTVARSGNSYAGSFSYVVYDLSGNQIFSTNGDIEAQRITAD
jgi:hypothetical protein